MTGHKWVGPACAHQDGVGCARRKPRGVQDVQDVVRLRQEHGKKQNRRSCLGAQGIRILVLSVRVSRVIRRGDGRPQPVARTLLIILTSAESHRQCQSCPNGWRRCGRSLAMSITALTGPSMSPLLYDTSVSHLSVDMAPTIWGTLCRWTLNCPPLFRHHPGLQLLESQETEAKMGGQEGCS